jgi:hypothetical protein
MSYGISNVETNMLFIETGYVVDVTGNPLCRQKGGREAESFRVGSLTWQKVALYHSS